MSGISINGGTGMAAQPTGMQPYVDGPGTANTKGDPAAADAIVGAVPDNSLLESELRERGAVPAPVSGDSGGGMPMMTKLLIAAGVGGAVGVGATLMGKDPKIAIIAGIGGAIAAAMGLFVLAGDDTSAMESVDPELGDPGSNPYPTPSADAGSVPPTPDGSIPPTSGRYVAPDAQPPYTGDSYPTTAQGDDGAYPVTSPGDSYSGGGYADYGAVSAAVDAAFEGPTERQQAIQLAMQSGRSTSDIQEMLRSIDDAFTSDTREIDAFATAVQARHRSGLDVSVLARAMNDAFDDEDISLRLLKQSIGSPVASQTIATVARDVDAMYTSDQIEADTLSQMISSGQLGSSTGADFGTISRAVEDAFDDDSIEQQALQTALASGRSGADIALMLRSIDDAFTSDVTELDVFRAAATARHHSGNDVTTLGRAINDAFDDEGSAQRVFHAALRSGMHADQAAALIYKVDAAYTSDAVEEQEIVAILSSIPNDGGTSPGDTNPGGTIPGGTSPGDTGGYPPPVDPSYPVDPGYPGGEYPGGTPGYPGGYPDYPNGVLPGDTDSPLDDAWMG